MKAGGRATPPRIEALFGAAKSLREDAAMYDSTELPDISLDDYAAVSDADVRHRQQVAAELRALANDFELRAVRLLRRHRRKSR